MWSVWLIFLWLWFSVCLSFWIRTTGLQKLPDQRDCLWNSLALMGFPGGSDGKASSCNGGDLDSIPGWGRSPGEGNGNLLQYSCLENPVDREVWQATVHGVTRIRHDLATKPLCLYFDWKNISVFVYSFFSMIYSNYLLQSILSENSFIFFNFECSSKWYISLLCFVLLRSMVYLLKYY